MIVARQIAFGKAAGAKGPTAEEIAHNYEIDKARFGLWPI